MFIEESVWISSSLQKLEVDSISPLLNIGSSTAHFREVEQAFINDNIFKKLVNRGVKVMHTDLQKDEGVDLVGDLTDGYFTDKLRELKFKAIICSNLLEHLEEITRLKICKVLDDILEKNGYLILTVPKVYPYHEDPIDTWYRPDLDQLAACFPAFKIIEQFNVLSDVSFFDELKRRPKNLLMSFIKLFLPFYKYTQWVNDVKYFPKWFKKYNVSCVLLQKK